MREGYIPLTVLVNRETCFDKHKAKVLRRKVSVECGGPGNRQMCRTWHGVVHAGSKARLYRSTIGVLRYRNKRVDRKGQHNNST